MEQNICVLQSLFLPFVFGSSSVVLGAAQTHRRYKASFTSSFYLYTIKADSGNL